ncbi:MAG: DUF22 domain-containing protein [Candidatus Nezhaarchaeota archaeon]|nr:DUF22 domain-containing protein [Candidatus Nezhaarchaeota archaeon]MCX8142365.1 DUF22 domain-containing protein [Candidatus Nezhaarchaeota archaeon]MDW8050662.1 DUF22 domain-containing protein [Nitrososphaerota archaeon]
MSHPKTITIKYFSRKTGEIKSFKHPSETFDYIISTAGRWVNVVADEDLEVKAGQHAIIRIEPIKLYPKELMIACAVSRHALGILLGVHGSEGRPQRVEEERLFEKAIFYVLKDGVIERGDLLGVMNVLIVYEVIEKHVIRTCLSPEVAR